MLQRGAAEKPVAEKSCFTKILAINITAVITKKIKVPMFLKRGFKVLI